MSGARQLRRHAGRVFLVMCQGDVELGNLALRASVQAWAEARRLAKQPEQREVHRQRGLRVLLSMADKEGVVLLRGSYVEWRSEADKARETRRVTALRRSQERQKATVERSVAVWASGQATIVEGSAFVSLRDVVLGVRQLRRHAERVFLVLREGDGGCCNGE